MSEEKTILIAEDNDFVRMQIVQYLSGESYKTLEATDGNQALEVMNNDNVDMAIVDVRMEPMGGFDFVRNIRARDVDTPVVFVTGDNDPSLLSQSSEWDVGAVLIKPVQKDRLISTVQRLLQRHQAGGR